MTLVQLIQAAQVAKLQHGADVEVIVRVKQRAKGVVDEWELHALEVDEPHKPWDGGETVVVLRVEG